MKPYKILLSLSLILYFSSCKQEIVPKDYTFQGLVFGTSYKIVYLNGKDNYQKSIDSLFYLMNKSLSTYIPTSDISKINKGDSTVLIDDLFKEVYQKSKRIYLETDGFFDPTVGNLVNSWGFGPKNEKKDLTEEQVNEQMKFVGLEKISLDKGMIRKQHPEIYLDFNSIAKGFGIDVVARFLDSKKIDNYLVEIGGEIRTKGYKDNNKPWIIKLVNPLKKNEESGFKEINLSNKSMATSGNYRKFRVSNQGKKYVHTVNPKTGYATESNLLSASVIANLDCADVDAYATAFMAMGLEKTKEFLRKNKQIDVILIFTNDNGNLEEFSTYTYN
ncbi:FAD:protein FMN transferase [Polaribacter pectinis]|uniref:FAD:protein FMN transferase n=1 Tax=Polaribacter pectinis TaxID=2738844 RepID=A0A7G9L7T6_9FLAO|nr:FAD:protein FMN transferase [Polaribacter pectinis]QNM84685.1 FAD:protein FMN transferase [Polaribacter pectinis]